MTNVARQFRDQVRTEPQKVFVYGTLKKGYGNNERFLKDCKELGIATINGLMFHLGPFPAINLGEPFSQITGEVYEVNWDHILKMDILEGVANNFYDRVQVRTNSHGLCWTYICPYERARTQEFIVPSGVWRGPDTPKVKWGGFGRGAEIGAFETNPKENVIKVASTANNDHILIKSFDGTYKLIHKKSGNVLGSYQHLRDMISKDGTIKPVLRLPAKVEPINNAVRETLEANTQLTVIPPDHSPVILVPPESIRTSDPKVEEEEDEDANLPQAARLLGFKYGPA